MILSKKSYNSTYTFASSDLKASHDTLVITQDTPVSSGETFYLKNLGSFLILCVRVVGLFFVNSAQYPFCYRFALFYRHRGEAHVSNKKESIRFIVILLRLWRMILWKQRSLQMIIVMEPFCATYAFTSFEPIVSHDTFVIKEPTPVSSGETRFS